MMLGRVVTHDSCAAGTCAIGGICLIWGTIKESRS